jgi:hypothetical protein
MISEIHIRRSIILIPPSAPAPFKGQRFGRSLTGGGIVEFAIKLKITDCNHDGCGHVLLSPSCSVAKTLQYLLLKVKMAQVKQHFTKAPFQN